MPELIPQAVTRRLGLALTGYRASDTVAWGNRGAPCPPARSPMEMHHS
jgi:hypothetical protein